MMVAVTLYVNCNSAPLTDVDAVGQAIFDAALAALDLDLDLDVANIASIDDWQAKAVET